MTSDTRKALQEEARFLLAMAAYIDRTSGLSMEPHLRLSVDRMLREAPLSKARQGLRQARNGYLEETIDFSAQQLADMDAFMRERGLPLVTTVRAQVRKTVPKALSRGRIRDDTEFYVVSEALADTSDCSLSEEQRSAAGELLAAYEASRKTGQ